MKFPELKQHLRAWIKYKSKADWYEKHTYWYLDYLKAFKVIKNNIKAIWEAYENNKLK